MVRGAPRCARARGFGYVGLIVLVAILSVSATGALQAGAVVQRRDAELALLRIGAEYQRALDRYAAMTPVGQPRTPRKLDDLLADRRYPVPVRHLRRLYPDPLTGKTTWGTVAGSIDPRGIVAIYSLAPGRPIKVANFSDDMVHLEHKRTYREWKFMSREEGEAMAGAR